MDKRFVQDIVPSERRTIRRVEEKITRPRVMRTPPPRIQPERSQRRFPSVLVGFIIIFIAVSVMAVALSLLYSKAVVTITPKVAQFNIEGTFTAQRNIESALPREGEYVYEIVPVSDTDTRTIRATDGPLIETKAKGTVTFYNEQTVPQKIVAGTRVAHTSGLIYRTTSTVTIPAKKVVVGSVTVGLVADETGAEYNLSLSSDSASVLRVVAYKGGPKYTTVYSKLKTDITGGFSGTKKIIAPADQKAALQSAKDDLKVKLLQQVTKNIPKDYVFYKNAYTIDYITAEPVSKDSTTALITTKATLFAVVFKKTGLIKTLAKKELDKFPSTTYDIRGAENLTFSIVNQKDFSAKKGNPLIFSLKGPITIVGTLSDSALKNELKGTTLKGSNAIFAHYPAIANAYALITPFWMRSFPKSSDKITIEIKE